ncbi:hypothetical protein PIB30_102690, partial [Stylosanthes scabra]|nr:hypothetical protein [Stylosanthes scabra]
MNQERMRYDQILQEAAVQQARDTNKDKAREVVPDSEEELASSASEEWIRRAAGCVPYGSSAHRKLKRELMMMPLKWMNQGCPTPNLKDCLYPSNVDSENVGKRRGQGLLDMDRSYFRRVWVVQKGFRAWAGVLMS